MLAWSDMDVAGEPHLDGVELDASAGYQARMGRAVMISQSATDERNVRLNFVTSVLAPTWIVKISCTR